MIKHLFYSLFLLNFTFTFGQYFKEVGSEKGLSYIYPGNDYQEVGSGITVFDFNNDGWDDFFQSGGVFTSKLWMNNKGTFVDVTSKYGLDILNSHFIQAAVAGDFDNDGFEDLFICNMGKEMFMGDSLPPMLLHNNGGNGFSPVFQETFNKIENYAGASWGDINNDGFLDLYVLNYLDEMGKRYDTISRRRVYVPRGYKNQLFLNDGGKGFRDVAPELKLDDNGCGLASALTDFDNDGDLDLILLNDFGQWNHVGNRIFRNEFPKFEFKDVSNELKFYQEFYGMGVGIGDINNDGRLDYYLTNIGTNYLYLNEKDGFKEVAQNAKLAEPHKDVLPKGTSWTGQFFDYDLDGDVDLYLTKGYLNSLEKSIVLDDNRFFLNDGKGVFEDVTIGSGANDSLSHRGAAYFDFDHDGDLDVVSSVIKMQKGEFGGLDQKIKLYENLNKSKNNWIGIKLVGSNGVNSSAIGAHVSFESKGLRQIREVDGGSGHGSQNTRILYFGIGKAKDINNLTIDWMNGKQLIVPNLKANQVIEISVDGLVKVVY